MTPPAPFYQDEYVTLYRGDCLEAGLVELWTAAAVLITDPPYGIAGGRLSKHAGPPTHPDAGWDDLATRDAALAAWGDKPRAVFGSPKDKQPPAHRGVPLVWDKGSLPGMGDHTWPFGASYELVWIAGDGWAGRRRGAVLRTVQPSSRAREIGHPTPKPVPLMETLISYAPAGLIADPFAGSGSTLIAAKALGRRAIGVEIDPAYCAIAAARLAQDVLFHAAHEAAARSASVPSST